MRSPPPDLVAQQLEAVLAEGWGLRAVSLEYLPEGAGSHHWTLTGGDGLRHFVTVDDLDNKDWIGGSREKVRDGLDRAYRTAATLRAEAGLQFVTAPIAARDGRFLRRVDERYSASVFPFLAGRSHGFGPYADARLRGSVLDMICVLHQSTPIVRTCAPRHVLRFAGREDLHAFLASPGQRWDSGPFAEAARRLLVPHAADLARLVTDFDRLVESTRRVRARLVITHGEPHPANVMAVDGRLVLIDWDTVGLAPPERDVSLIVTAANEGIERYQQATGIGLSPAVITLYRLRWYLDDLGSATRMFRNAHHDTADTRRWRDGLSGQLDRLPEWREVLG
jgi:spectinomycin phosphotransferase